MPTLSQNITNTITYLDEIRDAIIGTKIGMPTNEKVANYANYIKNLMPIVLEVSPTELEFPGEGGTNKIIVNSNISYGISTPDWITYTISNNEIDCIAELNDNGPRTSTIRVAGIDYPNCERLISISQDRRPDTLEVSTTMLTLSPRIPSATLDIISNSDWTVTTDYPLTITPTSGSKNQTITVSTDTFESTVWGLEITTAGWEGTGQVSKNVRIFILDN